MNKDAVYLERVQEEVRRKFCPHHERQRQAHFQILGLRGPVKLGGKAIVRRAMRTEGYEPVKGRKWFQPADRA